MAAITTNMSCIKASVIIAFYNRIDYLKFLLAGLSRQTMPEFEVIIADDGSSEDVVSELISIKDAYPFTIKHLWHEDKGFRKNKIMNRAITSAASDYLIFLDGDCVPHSEYVAEHYKNRRQSVCLTGRRVNLSEIITLRLTEKSVRNGFLENNFLALAADGIFGKSFDVEKGIYLRSQLLRKYVNKKKRGLLGCNFSLHKIDFVNINGFDERYELPSIGEDSDPQYRLELNGVRIVSLNNIAVQYHLYHKLQTRPQTNLDLFEQIKKEGRAFTSFGIVK